ncbi:tumor necrosis factor alpha-induced protein 2 isoform X2 [Varanus komodoensis]|nr:tumor necrosis factor alpha-induced protein 2 isoform X2 [Varanus komodoensis]
MSLESSTEEAQPRDSMKEGSAREEQVLAGSPPGDRGTSPCTPGQKKHKKGIKGKLVKVFFGKTPGKNGCQDQEKDEERKQVEEINQPITAEQIRELIKNQKFFKASQYLLVMEKVANGDSDNKNEEVKVEDWSEIPSLFGLLKQKLLSVLRSSVVIASSQPELLQDAIRTMVDLVEQDERVGSEEKAVEQLTPSQIRNWKEEWRNTVQASVVERMKAPTANKEGLSATAQSFLHMGSTMKEDLITVVKYIKPHYPEHFQVCSTYAKYYYHCFFSQLEMIARFELGSNDTYLLLTWVQNLYPNQIRNHPILAKELDESSLGNLLSSRQVEQLEATYRANEASSVKHWLGKILEVEVTRWKEGKEPEILDGHFHSELAIDAIQTIYGAYKRAEDITPELGKEMSVLLLEELLVFLQSYKKKMESFIKENKLHQYYGATIIANVNNCLSFRTHTEESTVSTQKEVKEKIFTTLNEIQNLGFEALLHGLFLELQPLFRKFTQKKWISCTDIIDEIIAVTCFHSSIFRFFKDPLQEAIMGKVHLHLVREYITRLLRKKVSLKTPELQNNLCELVRKDASILQNFCTTHGSKASWLNSALPSLAEIIRLQDTDAIMVEVGVLANNYPDISKKHLQALLYIKGNLSSGDYKTLPGVLDLGVHTGQPPTSLFASIRMS